MPSLAGILSRPQIRRPVEEFYLPPLPEDEQPPIISEDFNFEPSPDLQELVFNEAAAIQDLIDLLEETAEDASLSTALSHQDLGTSVTTRQYIAATSKSDRDRRIRQSFEDSSLQGCGLSTLWPTTLLPDLRTIRDELLMSAGVVEQQLLQSVPTSATSGLYQYTQTLMRSSQQYRQTINGNLSTYNVDARSAFLRYIVGPATLNTESLQKGLSELEGILRKIRALLCHAQLLWALRFKEARSALEAVVQDALLSQLISIVTASVQQVENAVVSPVLGFLESGWNDGGTGPLDLLQDDVSRLLATAVLQAAGAVTYRYRYLAAELLRTHQQSTQARLMKLNSLGQRNQIGRWILHIDAILSIIQMAKQQGMTALVALASLQSIVQHGPGPTSTKTLDRMRTLGFVGSPDQVTA